MKVNLSYSLLFFAALAIGSAIPANAQAGRCSLKINVIADGSGDDLSGISGKAISIDTEEIIDAVVDGSTLIFNDLTRGAKYTFLAKKDGHKRSLDERIIICADEKPELTGTISMVRGNPKETFVTRSQVMGAFRIGSVDRGDTDSGNVAPSDYGVRPVPKIVSKGVINGSALVLPKPSYPVEARAAGANGPVNVQVTIDEEGNVISAAAVSGHELLRAVSEQAARGSKFKPTLLQGVPVKVSGIIVYNFQ